MRPALTVSHLSKSFGPKNVLNEVSFAVKAGTVHALLGANGAGKSTLIKILSGLERQDGGTISVAARGGTGDEPEATDADAPRRKGRLGVIHQDLGLVDQMSVADNLLLGPGHALRMTSPRKERHEARRQLEEAGLKIDPTVPLSYLSLGEKTMVAVTRLFEVDHPDLIVLDEVTAALNRTESDWLLQRMRAYVATGGSVLLVTHRMHEVGVHCDEVTVLQDGIVHYSGPTPEITDLHTMLAGSNDVVPVSSGKQGRVVLRSSGAVSERVGPVDLEVHAGEVVALFGSLSSRLYDVGHLLAGRQPCTSGSVEMTAPDNRAGTASILAEDRRGLGILTGMTVAENISVSALRQGSRWGFVRHRRTRDEVLDVIETMNVLPPACADMPMLALSGGNQQKALLGRVSMTAPDVYVLCEPTRGVDLPARAAIRAFIRKLRDSGAAVVIVTIDVDDALATADRVAVVENGRVTDCFPIADTSAQQLLEIAS